MENYVVISDVHLGQNLPECTFADPGNVDRFVTELTRLGKINQLVLLGDFLELALSPMATALIQMEVFFDGIHKIHSRIGKIVYVPGNHDHHIWTLHVERKMVDRMEIRGKGEDFISPDYVGNTFAGAESFLSGYLSSELKNKWEIKYPIHEITLSNGKTCLLHHGHQIYGIGVRLLSLREALKEVRKKRASREKMLIELELQNIGVYELLWYYLELSESMRERLKTQWKKNGDLGAFAVVANEIADKRPVSFVSSVYNSFLGKPEDQGRAIVETKQEIKDYLELLGKRPDCLVYGHSHIPKLVYTTELRCDIPASIIGNCGSWLDERRKYQNYNTYIVLNRNGVYLRKLSEKEPIRYISW